MSNQVLIVVAILLAMYIFGCINIKTKFTNLSPGGGHLPSTAFYKFNNANTPVKIPILKEYKDLPAINHYTYPNLYPSNVFTKDKEFPYYDELTYPSSGRFKLNIN